MLEKGQHNKLGKVSVCFLKTYRAETLTSKKQHVNSGLHIVIKLQGQVCNYVTKSILKATYGLQISLEIRPDGEVTLERYKPLL